MLDLIDTPALRIERPQPRRMLFRKSCLLQNIGAAALKAEGDELPVCVLAALAQQSLLQRDIAGEQVDVFGGGWLIRRLADRQGFVHSRYRLARFALSFLKIGLPGNPA